MDQHLRTLLLDAADNMQILLEEQALERFGCYLQELLLWNEKMNLLSFHSYEDILVKHFIDSLTPFPYIERKQGKLLDIGSGAGFPGVPLKIILPSLKVFLMESSRKKCSFLKHLIRHLALADISVIHSRAEKAMIDPDFSQGFDTVISRAACRLPEYLSLGRHFIAPGGKIIAMQGPRSETETVHLNDLGLQPIAVQDIHLPLSKGGRKIFIYQIDISSSKT
jgi:16S rRNA (guanine527-N7)-methyltransferase